MADEYFDEEELINDFIEEDCEEPSTVLDESAAMDWAFTPPCSNRPSTTQQLPKSLFLRKPRAHENGVDDEKNAAEEKRSDGPPPFPTEVHVAAKLSKKQDDLFAFERYKGNCHDWRSRSRGLSSSNHDKHNIKHWTRRHKETASSLLNRVTHDRRKTTVPVLQLLEFGEQKLCRDFHANLSLSENKSISFKPEKGTPSVIVTIANGTVLHVAKLDRENTTEISRGVRDPHHSETILKSPIEALFHRSDTLRRRTRAKVDRDTRMLSCAPSQQLWVDKHAPSDFRHLLSDERTNREVLRAIRAWDKYVFGKEPPKRPVTSYPSKTQQQHNEESRPPHDRVRPSPSARAILLCGPPGVGKTTLAHIVAQHAGYRPLEINASDERSSGILKDRVLRAMESSTLQVTTASTTQGSKQDSATPVMTCGKPNCLILDEVDGADAKNAVASLVEIIRADLPAPPKAGKYHFLRRPIVFIANHKYVPALRPLLPFCIHFDIHPPSDNRLVTRLRTVLSLERLSLFGGSTLLHQLVANAGGDIRSCLNTLQFVAARARELKPERKQKERAVIDLSQALQSVLLGKGLKDSGNDITSAISTVFRAKKGSYSSSEKTCESTNRVLHAVEAYGDNSRTLDCIFTNVPHISFVDPTLVRCSMAHEWMSSCHLYRSRLFEHSVLSSTPAMAGAVHLLCRVETKTDKLTFSARKMNDVRYGTEARASLATKFLTGLPPHVRAAISTTTTVVLETAPYTLWLLSAGLGSAALRRSVSSFHLLQKSEREAFVAHVKTLRALGLKYVVDDASARRELAGTSAPRMRLEPEVDRLSEFEGLVATERQRRRWIPSALKELFNHHASLASVKDRESRTKRPSPFRPPFPKRCRLNSAKAMQSKESGDREDLPTTTESHQKQLAKETAKLTSKSPGSTFKNFLGRAAVQAKASRLARKAAKVGLTAKQVRQVKRSHTGSNQSMSCVIRFKYQKGFTQAVRTPCRLRDLV